MVINLFGPMVFIYLIVRFWSSDPVSFKIAAYVILTVNDLWLVVLKYSELVTLTMPVQSTSKTNTRIPDLSKKSNFYMFWDNFSVLKTWPDLQNPQISINCVRFCDVLHFISLRAKQVREVVNLTERKNPQTPVYGDKEFVFLSVINSGQN